MKDAISFQRLAHSQPAYLHSTMEPFTKARSFTVCTPTERFHSIATFTYPASWQ